MSPDTLDENSSILSPLGSDTVLDAIRADAREGEVLHDAVEEPRVDGLDGRQRVRGELDGPAEPPELVCLLDYLYLKNNNNNNNNERNKKNKKKVGNKEKKKKHVSTYVRDERQRDKRQETADM